MGAVNGKSNGDYFAAIPEGRLLDDRQVELKHKQRYSIHIENRGSLRCDVDIRCDNKEIGVFRLNGKQSAKIERSVYDDGFLTFYRIGTRESIQAKIGSNELTGRVLIRFTPEKQKRVYAVDDGILYSGERSGGTGLSGHSEQEFYEVETIERDDEKAKKIEFRLVGEDDKPRPLIGSEKSDLQKAPLWERGINRFQFAIGFLICLIIGAIMIANNAGGGLLFPLAIIMFLQAMRLRDMGRHRAWTFLSLAPVLGLFVLVPCLIAPTRNH